MGGVGGRQDSGWVECWPQSEASLRMLISVPGASFTRFQTKLLTRAFPSVLTDQLVSYGPCQFPTLGFVVERVSGRRGEH